MQVGLSGKITAAGTSDWNDREPLDSRRSNWECKKRSVSHCCFFLPSFPSPSPLCLIPHPSKLLPFPSLLHICHQPGETGFGNTKSSSGYLSLCPTDGMTFLQENKALVPCQGDQSTTRWLCSSPGASLSATPHQDDVLWLKPSELLAPQRQQQGCH